ncbi:GTP pyrophosphokinase family protein [Candidatus Riflebacteria bacterium]
MVDNLEELRERYKELRPKYEFLAISISNTLEAILKKNKINYLTVENRVKTLDSFEEKIRREDKDYKDPFKDMADFTGIRVITYLEDEVASVGRIIRKSFNTHVEQSINKTEELGPDRFGYRSVHYICDIGRDREKLPESEPYKGLLFEIQVRTLLQHAWAEIEHDRNYKFCGALPREIKRRFNSIAGLLEIADREFNSLARDIEDYASDVKERIKNSDLSLDLDSKSIGYFLSHKGKIPGLNFLKKRVESRTPGQMDKVVKYLKKFGIKTLFELDEILTKEYLQLFRKHKCHYSDYRILNSAMLFADIDKFFSRCHNNREGLSAISESTCKLLQEKYEKKKIDTILNKFNVKKVALA